MGIGDIRYTVLQTVQEVFRKLGLASITSLSANKLTIQCVDFINDICNDLSDFGNWQEMLVTANITAVSGQADYSVSTSANIKNIGDIYFGNSRGPMRSITIDEMRLLSQGSSSTIGTPTQFTIFGTDSNGNPNIRMRPRPSSSGSLFSILYFVRTPQYTTSDASLVVPFPARVLVLGVLAKCVLNEGGGAPDNKYQALYQEYLTARKEAYNRFKGDTNWNVSFSPSITGRRR